MESNYKPSQWALRLFRWLCHPDFKEEIEGDLLEKFAQDCRNENLSVAKRNFQKEVLQLIRWNIIFKKGDTMNTKKWGTLLLVTSLLIGVSFVPFLPGSYSTVAIGASALVQMAGFFGLLLVPVGSVWLLLQMRTKHVEPKIPDRWVNGYYLSLLAFIPTIGFLTLLLAVGFNQVEISERALFMSFIVVLIIFCYSVTARLKNSRSDKFNFLPLYLIVIPLAAWCTKNFWVEKIADISRDNAIVQSLPLIEALEEYHSENGIYPVSLDELKGKYLTMIPSSGVIGIKPYVYEKTGNSYQLSFVQWLHWGATEEIVIYSRVNQAQIKGYFAGFSTKYPDWRYYWFD